MRTFSLIALGAAVAIHSGILTSALAADLNVTAVAPLKRAPPDLLDKAKGIGPRFKFFSAPQGLSEACAASVDAHVNEGDFVDYPIARTLEEFRSVVASKVQLNAREAERTSVHTGFALAGKDHVSGATCVNLKAAPEERGSCTGTISGTGYIIVYGFDPVLCRYDNLAVAESLETRLFVASRNDTEPELDCATKLEGFVTDIDDLLVKSPRSIIDVFKVLNRHFPLHGCSADVASRIMKKSRYFRSMQPNGPKKYVFSLSSATASSRGVAVSFGLTDSGDSSLPWAMWWPPFP
ncbi:MAG TPA: hypothetical protein VH934_00300 [Xanthobacteraceae bacterium]|jgi:hypothetical protein